MALPMFTAEASLGKSRRTYRSKHLSGYLSENLSGSSANVLPSQLAYNQLPLQDEDQDEMTGPEVLPRTGGSCNCGGWAVWSSRSVKRLPTRTPTGGGSGFIYGNRRKLGYDRRPVNAARGR
jgi:hypothetical protein